MSCNLFKIYIKPQPFYESLPKTIGCNLFKIYIKPQQYVR